MWWEILKSSRGEAYAKFVEEFGPEVDLNQIKFNDRKLTQGDWLIHMDTWGDITIHSEKYRPYLAFVEGMFKEEYPERNREIGKYLSKLISENKKERRNTENKKEGVIDSSFDLPNFSIMSSSDRKMWLNEHDFCYRANGNFVGLDVRNYLIGSLLSFYDGWSAEDTTGILRNGTSYNFGEFTSIGELFLEYKEHLHDWNYDTSELVRRKLGSTTGQFEILVDILRGTLIPNPYHQKHFGRDGGIYLGIKIRKPKEE